MDPKELVWFLLSFTVTLAVLFALRIAASLPLSAISAVIYSKIPKRKQVIHLTQGAVASVIAIYSGWYLLQLLFENPHPANFAFTMGFGNIGAAFCNRSQEAHRSGTFADSIGGIIGSGAIWAIGFHV